jgi:hypothetical protein
VNPLGRRHRGGCVRGLLAGLLVGCSTGGSPTIIVTKVPGDQRPVEIVSTSLSKANREGTITFRSSFGIFAFDLDLAGANLTRLTLLIQHQQYCEGLDFWPRGGQKVELRHTDGVKISKRGEDLAIEIEGPALAHLKPGGRVQYVNQYR